jgi:hypothetical protein
MTDKKYRERVIAEITLSHLMRLGNEQGCPVSRGDRVPAIHIQQTPSNPQ